MDDTKLRFLIIWVSAAVLGFTVGAAELEYKYISPVERQTLGQMFDSAPKSDFKERLADRKWGCDMYGMRTTMRVQRQTRLYDFHLNASTWKNAGALPITSYRVKDGELDGDNAKVHDRVRMTSRGQLVSQLSTEGTPSTVIAYSVCQPI